MERQDYPTDLTDEQWKILQPLIPPAKPGGRPRRTNIREVINAIFYLLRAGYVRFAQRLLREPPWRLLPHDFPPWQTVYTYCRQWQKDGTWKAIDDTLHQECRQQDGREVEASAAIIDSQSVKTTEKGGFLDMMSIKVSRVASGISWLTQWV